MTEQGRDPAKHIAELERQHAQLGEQIETLQDQLETTRRHRDPEEYHRLWRQRHKTLMKSVEGTAVVIGLLGSLLSGSAPDVASPGTPRPRPETARVLSDPEQEARQKLKEAQEKGQNIKVTLADSGELSIQYLGSEGDPIFEYQVGNVIDALTAAGRPLTPGTSTVVSFRVGTDLLEITVVLHVRLFSRKKELRLKSHRYKREGTYDRDDLLASIPPPRLLDR
jgi:hypothetical protein